MTISIEEAGTGIKAQIDDIATLRQVFAPNELPLSPNVFPCALIIPGPVNYGETFASDAGVPFRVLVLMAPLDSKIGMDNIIPLMEPSGDNSINAKIIADKTLGGRADTCIVRSCSEVQATPWGERSYMSIIVNIDVYI